jgi:predicted nucleic acid-binding protein
LRSPPATPRRRIGQSCDTLWSEDVPHGMKFDEGLLIANPFRGK